MHRTIPGYCITALGIVFMLGLLCAQTAFAFRVEPMSYSLEPVGSEARRTIRVENSGTTPLAIETSVFRRTMNADGELEEKPEHEDFVIFPPQSLIGPGATQAIRVQYVGPADINQSRSYTVSIRQLPVSAQEEDEEGAGVQVVFHFGTAAHVIPRGASPDVRVSSVDSDHDNKKLVVVLENRGNSLTNLSQSRWHLGDDAGNEKVLEGEGLESILGNPVLFPSDRRVFQIPIDESWGLARNIRVRIDQ